VKIENLEWAQWLDQVYGRHAFDLSVVSHAEPMDYAIYDKTDYYFGYHSAAFHGLMEALKATTDEAQRTAILRPDPAPDRRGRGQRLPVPVPRLGVFDARLKDFWVNSPTQTVDLHTAYFDGPLGQRTTTGDQRGQGAIVGVMSGVAVVAAWP
jgi:peptide/nickel transport system substrate-binding protein